MIDGAGPWGTGPYKLVEGFSLPDKRSDQVVLEANTDYWDPSRFPQLQRIIFDNTLTQQEALQQVQANEGKVDLVTDLRPLETLGVAQSPYAKVVKNRGALVTLVGMFNMRKADSPWRDIRVRRAANVAINRAHVVRYAAKGNGIVTPALVAAQGYGYAPDLAPYPFDFGGARRLLQEAGFPNGLAISLLSPEGLNVQATVVGKMLEQVGFDVDLQILDGDAYNRKTLLSHLAEPTAQQSWDIALASWGDMMNFSLYLVYHYYALDGAYDWVIEKPELRRLYEQALRTVDRDQQQALIRQMEWHTRDQAYFLFLYNPIGLYAVNTAVEFVPYVTTTLNLAETSVTEQHWSVRKQKAAVQE